MNLAQMLMQKVTPLEAIKDGGTVKRPYSEKGQANSDAANKARHDKSVEKYKAVVGTNWFSTNEVERKLGFARGSAACALHHWYEKELLERRNRDNSPVFNRRQGYEWRFKE